MTSFSRLLDVFLPEREPQAALYCTYGLDAHFFEAEVLPWTFPLRLGLDRTAGSAAGYLNAADRALQNRFVGVYYDHLLLDGPQLPYLPVRVDVSPGAFHPKLVVLDYGDTIRVVVASANLTRPAWSELLELFVVEDLSPAVAHPWAPVLRRFVRRLAEQTPPERRDEVLGLSKRLSERAGTTGRSSLLSSWDGPLLEAALAGVGPLSRVDVVSPFLEGEEGAGVFDALDHDRLHGRLFLDADETDDGLAARGPQAKIDQLMATRRWTLYRVRRQWNGDDEDARLRRLHGKVLSLVTGRRARVLVGSANVTRAALLGTPGGSPPGNVELCVLLDVDVQGATALLPQADPVDRDEIDIQARGGDLSGEDGPATPGPERHVTAALLWAEAGEVELRLRDGAPALEVRYEGRLLGRACGARSRLPLVLRAALFVEVDDGESTGAVALLVADPARLVPRGTPAALELDRFCDLLAGALELPPIPGDLPAPGAEPAPGAGFAGASGAIPWRRILRAIHALGDELVREAPFPRGVEFVLRNDTRLEGLRRRAVEAHANGRLKDADMAYVLYEVVRALRATAAAMPDEHGDSRALIDTVEHEVRVELAGFADAAGTLVRKQLAILAQGDRA